MYPPSFERDVRPLFRDRDIISMQDFGGFDLSSYEDVKQHAPNILARLEDKSMPCDQPWPDEKIALFRDWMSNGFPA